MTAGGRRPAASGWPSCRICSARSARTSAARRPPRRCSARLDLDMIHDIGMGWHSHVLQSEDGSRLAQWEQRLKLLPRVAAAVEAADDRRPAPLPRLPPPHGPAIRRPRADRDRRFADVRTATTSTITASPRSGSAWSITAPTTSGSRRSIAAAGIASRCGGDWASAKTNWCFVFVGHD